jgi:hypothetical protein
VSGVRVPDSPPFPLPGMRALLATVLLAVSAAAPAQQRALPIPEAAVAGQIRHVEQMVVEIDGQRQLLAPGAQIRDESNRLILPIAIPAGAKVKYLLDASGMVRQIWILTPEEVGRE